MVSVEVFNAEQRRAVAAGEGPVLIVAGPGTGKTKTLTARIVWLIENSRAKPGEIAALTFTNKAAREMRERVGSTRKLPKIATFHSLGADILQQLGLNEKLLDERQRTEIIQGISKPRELKGASTRELSLLISREKTSLQSDSDDVLRRLLKAYESELAKGGLHDFDDLLVKSFELLKSGHHKTKNFKYVMVDEFQDTSDLQYEILKLLSQGNNIFAIGDPKQSIYSFRGAGAEMFDRFRADYPDALEVDLTVNYRSVPEVTKLANTIFSKAPQLTAFQHKKGSVKCVETLNEYSEAAYVLGEIEQGIGGSDMLKAGGHIDVLEPRDFAVLYRTHRAATAVQRAFEASGIPYQIAGEGSPYERPEIMTVIAAMRAVHSPSNENKAELVKYNKIGSAKSTVINTLHVKYQDIDKIQVCDLAKSISEALGFNDSKYFEQFTGSLVQFGTCKPGLAACLRHIDQISESEFYDPTVNAVALLTIHAAKGLEFDHVFLIAAEEGVMPKITKSAETNIDEERRLFYVAVTRAKQTLEALYAKFRGGQPANQSRFISEIPETILPHTADPNMQQLERRAAKRRLKRAQSSLF